MKKFLASLIIFICLICTANAEELQLTPKEKQWLENHKVIRLSGPQAFPPFQFVDNDGVFKGMASDYIFHIAKMVGLKVEVAKKHLWSEILEKIQSREVDVLSCAAITSDRENYLLYTNPHLSFPLVIINRKDSPFISGLDDLKGKIVSITKKVSTYEWLQKDNINVKPYFVNTPSEGLKAVSLGYSEAAIENLAVATHLIEKRMLTNLKIAAPTAYGNYNLSIAVRSDWPELVSIINKALAAISQEKHNEIRQRWIGIRYDHGIQAQDILKWILLIGGVAAIILSFFFFWNRKLAKEIRERKNAESKNVKLINELQNALEEIKTLRGILPICSSCKMIRDDNGYWNQIESYIGKHTEAEFSHSICPSCVTKLYPGMPIVNESDS